MARVYGDCARKRRDARAVWTIARRVRRGDWRWAMSVVVHGRVVEHLQRLRLGFVAERLDAILAAKELGPASNVARIPVFSFCDCADEGSRFR